MGAYFKSIHRNVDKFYEYCTLLSNKIKKICTDFFLNFLNLS